MVDEGEESTEHPVPAVRTRLDGKRSVASLASTRTSEHPAWVDGPWGALRAHMGVGAAADIHRLEALVGQPIRNTVMCSPDGVFSHYSPDASVHISGARGLRFRYPRDHDPVDSGCRPRHLLVMYRTAAEAMDIMRRGGNRDARLEIVKGQPTYRYFRQSLAPLIPSLCARVPGLAPVRPNLKNVSLYLSDKNCLTNFHWDTTSGLVIQFRGRKRVWLVSPRHNAYMQSGQAHIEDSACRRRSRFTGREEMLPVEHASIILHPGQALFIPARWWHQVESLDEPTIGMIFRFYDMH